jgi:valyl-tRNA synthetase
MPFISEEIWQLIKKITPMEEEALIIAKFPTANEKLINKEIMEAMSFMQETIVAIRNMRKQVNISPAVNVDVVLKLAHESQKDLFNEYQGYICKLAKVENITMGVSVIKPASSMVAVVQDIQIFIPLKGLIDIEAEKTKLIRQIEKLEMELMTIQNKLRNEKFVNNAKPEVVAKEREKEAEIQTKLNTTSIALESL